VSHARIEKVVLSACCAMQISVSELVLWLFTTENQKTIKLLCQTCLLPQPFRRIVRFTGQCQCVWSDDGDWLLRDMLFGCVVAVMTGSAALSSRQCRPVGQHELILQRILWQSFTCAQENLDARCIWQTCRHQDQLHSAAQPIH